MNDACMTSLVGSRKASENVRAENIYRVFSWKGFSFSP